VYNLNGQELGTALVEYPLAHPRPTWAEQTADDWWNAAVDSIKGALALAQVPLASVEQALLDMHEGKCIKIAVVPDLE
jgi:sugar (pentulose or hexulose) kinase